MRQDPARIIKTLQRNNGHIRKTARETGVSPGTVINWRRRAATGSQGGRYLSTRPARQSTAPRSHRTMTLPAADQTAAAALREQTGYSARKLTHLLGVSCHWRTLHRLLSSKGVVQSGRTYRRPHFQETRHMYLKNVTMPGKLQMDVT